MKLSKRKYGGTVIIGTLSVRLYYVLASFAVTVLAARILGPAAFGQFTFLLSFCLLISGLAQSGFVPLIVRETAQAQNQRLIRSFLSRTAQFIFIGISLVFFALFMARDSLRIDDQGLFALFVLTLTLALIGVLTAGVRGIGNTILGQLPDLVIRPSLFVLSLVFISISGLAVAAHSLLMVYTVITIVSLLASLVFLKVAIKTKPAEGSAKVRPVDWLKKALQIAFVGWIGTAGSHSVIILVGFLADDASVGYFRVALQVSMLLTLGLAAVESVQAPLFTLAYKDNRHERLQQLLRTSSRVSILCAAPVGVIIFGAPQALVNVVFSESYSQAGTALQILALGQAVNAYFGSVGTLLISCNLERSVLKASAISLVILLVLSFSLIPSLGVLGASVASTVSLVTRNLLCAYVAMERLKVSPSPF